MFTRRDKLIVNDIVSECHRIAVSKGFWEASDSIPTKLMLIVSECVEAMNVDRDPNYTVDSYKETMAEELADVVIRVFDLAGFFHLDMGKAMLTKIQKNEDRPVLHGKRY